MTGPAAASAVASRRHRARVTPRRSGFGGPRRQRGVALIAAVLVVALAVVLVAALLDTGEAARARTRNSLRGEQTWQLVHGLEAWAAIVLMRDLDDGQIDSPGEAWAQPMPPLPIPGGRIHGRLRALGGCFNLNSLYHDEQARPTQKVRFERLLATLGLDNAIAAQALDWIDTDPSPEARGAEDLHYLQQRPPRRAANRPYTHVSELRLLPAVDADTYQRLAPHVCALPADAPTNLNLATLPVWMSLHEDITEAIARRLARDGQARHANIADIHRELSLLKPGIGITELQLAAANAVHSDYFVAEAELVVNEIPYAYATLLKRDLQGVRVVARTRGRL